MFTYPNSVFKAVVFIRKTLRRAFQIIFIWQLAFFVSTIRISYWKYVQSDPTKSTFEIHKMALNKSCVVHSLGKRVERLNFYFSPRLYVSCILLLTYCSSCFTIYSNVRTDFGLDVIDSNAFSKRTKCCVFKVVV